MATFNRREYTVRTVEYAVPSGTVADEFNKAWSAALADYRHRHNLAGDAAPDGGWLRVYPVDDEVVLRFEVCEEASGGR